MQNFESFEKQFTDEYSDKINRHYSSSFTVVDVKNWDAYSKSLIDNLGFETLNIDFDTPKIYDYTLADALVRLYIHNKNGKIHVMWAKLQST